MAKYLLLRPSSHSFYYHRSVGILIRQHCVRRVGDQGCNVGVPCPSGPRKRAARRRKKVGSLCHPEHAAGPGSPGRKSELQAAAISAITVACNRHSHAQTRPGTPHRATSPGRV